MKGPERPKREERIRREREPHAAPPDSGGGQGSFTRPDDVLDETDDREGRDGDAPPPRLAGDDVQGEREDRGAGKRTHP